ncbi:MAG: FmdB family zinc ribbon protein [Oceanidesulfovibrio sp.]
MPLYEYRCSVCNSEFEELMNASTTDDECHAPACPKCGSTQTRRIMSAAAVRSGSGSLGGLGGSLGPSGGGCAPSGGFS